MKRALAFLVFGPVLAAVTALLVMAKTSGADHDFAKIFAIAVFFFTLPVSAITGCIDGVLSDVPVPLRAALTATAGALLPLAWHSSCTAGCSRPPCGFISRSVVPPAWARARCS